MRTTTSITRATAMSCSFVLRGVYQIQPEALDPRSQVPASPPETSQVTSPPRIDTLSHQYPKLRSLRRDSAQHHQRATIEAGQSLCKAPADVEVAGPTAALPPPADQQRSLRHCTRLSTIVSQQTLSSALLDSTVLFPVLASTATCSPAAAPLAKRLFFHLLA